MYDLPIQGQEWSRRINIAEKDLATDKSLSIFEKGKPEASANTKEIIHFFSADASFNLISFSTESRNLSFGFHRIFEVFLLNEKLTIKDFLTYSFEIYTNITNSLSASLSVENFLNFNDNSFELEPVMWNDDRLANLTILENATAHFINISINYSF